MTILTLVGCDGDKGACPASSLEVYGSCNLSEETKCTYDCNGCGGPQVSICKGGQWQTPWPCECPADIGLHDTLPGDMSLDAGPPDVGADLCCNHQGQIVACFCPDAGIPCVDNRDFVECPQSGTCVPTGQACPSDGDAGGDV